ncbi:MAG TPA: hypothetical protein VNR63_05125 [Gaiellaceae bacterium]|jgi:hypothetical protein|nr:hypothetical protein [Gaiellaceae bacterium]
MPVLAAREWLTGIRPVAGAVGACGLMLLACSWFAFSAGGVVPGENTGAPAVVRIDDAFRETVGEPHALRAAAHPTPARPTEGHHTRQAPIKARSAGMPAGARRDPNLGAAPAPTAQAAVAAASAQAQVATPPSTSTPAPDLPEAPSFTVTTPAVPAPQTPSLPLPELPTSTQLGLP